MELLRNLSKIFNILFPYLDFLYLLQLEEYDTYRYWKLLPRFYFRRNLQKRDKLKYTSRIQTTFLLSLLLGIYSVFLFWVFSQLLLGILIVIITIPIYVGIANTLLTPFYNFMKSRLQLKAKRQMDKYLDLKVVTIAGSYGKTTTKNILYEIVRYNYKTQMIPGNINTPTGIATWLLKNFDPSTELLITEVDGYYLGEIRQSCRITPADVIIITAIGDQHLERLGTQKRLTLSLFESLDSAKRDPHLILSKNTAQTARALGIKFRKDAEVIETRDGDIKYNRKKILLSKDISSSVKANIPNVLAAVSLLGIPFEFVQDSLQSIELPERRQKPGEMYGYTVIDDSYNISYTTALAGLESANTLATKHDKKLLVITAGIPELGKENKDANYKYGKELQQKADYTVLLKSIISGEISKELENNYVFVNDLSEAWQYIHDNFSPDEIVILIQPELTDVYY